MKWRRLVLALVAFCCIALSVAPASAGHRHYGGNGGYGVSIGGYGGYGGYRQPYYGQSLGMPWNYGTAFAPSPGYYGGYSNPSYGYGSYGQSYGYGGAGLSITIGTRNGGVSYWNNSNVAPVCPNCGQRHR